MENQDQGPRKSRRDFLKLGAAATLGVVAGASGTEAVRTAEQLVSKQLPPDRGLNESKETNSVEVKATMQMVEYREGGETKRTPAVVIDLETMFKTGIVDPSITLSLKKGEDSKISPDELVILQGEFVKPIPDFSGSSGSTLCLQPGITHDINRLRQTLAVFFGVRLQPGKLVIPVFNEPVKPGERESKGMIVYDELDNRKGVRHVKDYSLTPASAQNIITEKASLRIDIFNGTPSILRFDPTEDKIIQERDFHKSGSLTIPDFGKFVTAVNKPTFPTSPSPR